MRIQPQEVGDDLEDVRVDRHAGELRQFVQVSLFRREEVTTVQRRPHTVLRHAIRCMGDQMGEIYVIGF